MTDSPGGNYDDQVISSLWTKAIDLSSAEAATMFFWAKIDLEKDFDYVYLQATPDNGMTWIQVAVFNGEGGDWEFQTINLGALAHEAAVQFRFYFVSDLYVTTDGMHIDDIKIASYNQDYSWPIPYYETGPLVVGTDPYVVTVDLQDPSGISESKLIYSVDGGPEMEVISDPASGASGMYSYTIPAQAPYSRVSYKITAFDNSPYLNYMETKNYEIIFGNYLYYENGDEYTDYLDIIGSDVTASAYAIAKRITMGPLETKDHYKADLVGFTIANYISEEYPSDPLYAHVWEDTGNGPGEDLIPPIYMVQGATLEDSYALTWVDLTSYSAELSDLEGDVYVGYTSAGTATNILYEVVSSHTGEPGYTAFKRSWLGIGNDAGVVWSLDQANVYHISAITGPYTLVDAPLAPLGLTGRGGEGNIILEWIPGVEDDIDYYNVYRGLTEDFTIGTPIGTVLATDPATYVDVAPTGTIDGYYYYKVTAVDVDSNEGSASKEVKINPTGIDGNIPLITALEQNYPNPFNPVTTINFSTAVEGNVNLTVYNTAGAVVAKLVDGRMDRGYHSVEFNASSLVSGIYYYSMKLNDKVFTHKMMLLK
ncbi:MAG: T9SS type A sorting domain-containing protein [Candidatus Delongbacteria bacterium]|nr:T9SS type A sorting domain-containing protein [Candidatus Delongbacteria bacterium]